MRVAQRAHYEQGENDDGERCRYHPHYGRHKLRELAGLGERVEHARVRREAERDTRVRDVQLHEEGAPHQRGHLLARGTRQGAPVRRQHPAYHIAGRNGRRSSGYVARRAERTGFDGGNEAVEAAADARERTLDIVLRAEVCKRIRKSQELGVMGFVEIRYSGLLRMASGSR